MLLADDQPLADVIKQDADLAALDLHPLVEGAAANQILPAIVPDKRPLGQTIPRIPLVVRMDVAIVAG